ncbi:MAG TPA: glucan biosynthesis protein G [Nevskiaceae bacterium]
MAQKLAQEPYRKPTTASPAALTALDHAEYQRIQYKRAARLWADAGGPFSVGFSLVGGIYRDAVKINEVDAHGVHPVTFRPDDFDLGGTKLSTQALDKAGFSGLTIYYRFPAVARGHVPPLSEHDQKVLSFQGANLFYGLGEGQTAGTSARSLAIDTGLQSGEEFPRFTEFWIERPAAKERAMVIDALMDSKRATAAYRFVVYPGRNTRVEVRARIYLRDYVTVLGLAPLNSMYLYGANQPARGGSSYRPEVHDADGLQIHSGTGEWLWRALINPARLLITSFSMTNPQGFGLMQRERDFKAYQDLQGHYEERPSVWVTPVGDWGAGRIELIELPTPDDTHDNAFVFWAPAQPPRPQTPLDLAYRVEWQGEQMTLPPSAWVTQTRAGNDFAPDPGSGTGFVIDFAGPALSALPPDAPVEGVISTDANGEILGQQVVHNSHTGGWRLYLKIKHVDTRKPVELRAYLRSGDNTVSETWSYIVPPT